MWHTILPHPNVVPPSVAPQPPVSPSEQRVIDIVRSLEEVMAWPHRVSKERQAEKNRIKIEIYDRLRDALAALAVDATFCLLDSDMRVTSKIRWGGEEVKWSDIFTGGKGRPGLVSDLRWDNIKRELIAQATTRASLLEGESRNKLAKKRRSV